MNAFSNEHIKTVEAVYRAGCRVITHYRQARHTFDMYWEQCPPDVLKLTELQGLTKFTEELGAMFDQVAGWWIADQPPAFFPEASSLLEAVLVVSSRFLSVARLAAAEPIAIARRAILASSREIDSWNPYIVFRCEVAAMSRRAPVSVNYFGAGLSFTGVRLGAERWADWRPLTETPWAEMTQEEKLTWLGGEASGDNGGRPVDPGIEAKWEAAKQLYEQLGNWTDATKEFNKRHGTEYEKRTVSGWGRYLKSQGRISTPMQ